MVPPPSAVIIPSVTTPTMSSRAPRSAVNAPLRAKAKVPARSRTRSGVVVDVMIRSNLQGDSDLAEGR